MAVLGTLEILSGLKTIGEKLGWWGQLSWPSEIDEAIAKLEKLEGRKLPHLRALRDDAHKCMITAERSYFDGHIYWTNKFKEAVRRCGEAIRKEAEDYEAKLKAQEKAKEEAKAIAEAEKITLSKILEKLKAGVSIAKEELSKLPVWALPLIIASVPGVIAIIIAIKRRGE